MKRAADAGERDAMLNLALRDETDKTILKNKDKIKLVQKAADLGSPGAQFVLAGIKRNTEDIEGYLKYIVSSSEQGYTEAQRDYAAYLLDNNEIDKATEVLYAILNNGGSVVFHDIVSWAYNELAYIHYRKGNLERALFCWKATLGEIQPRTEPDWDEIERKCISDWMNILGNSPSSPDGNTPSSPSNGGCLSVLAIPLFLGTLAYWLFA